MTELHRTPLSTSQKVNIGLQAATCQNYGVPLTDLSDEVGLSRPTLYETQATVHTLLEQHFSPPQEKGFYVWVDKAQLERAEVAIRMENRACMRGIENVLPFIYPGIDRTTLPTSLGSIQNTCERAEKSAKVFNKTPLYYAIKNAALDEMFSQGNPVLAGVDLDSGFLFLLQREKARGGTEWANALEKAKAQGLDLEKIVKDAGTGMASGVTQVYPKAEQRDDCFHVLYVLGQTLYLLERKAYGAIKVEEEAEIEHQKCKKKMMKKNKKSSKKTSCKKGKNQASLAQKLDWRKRECVDSIDRYDRFQAAYDTVVEGLSFVDLKTGELRSGEAARALFQEAADEIRRIDYHKSNKLANYLENRIPGLILSTQELYETLQALGKSYGKGGEAIISRICQLLRLDSDYEQRETLTPTDKKRQQGIKRWLQSMDKCLVGKVKYALEHRYRASSAIEGFNAALRPYLYLQKRVSDGFLELFQAYYNTRIRRFGRHKGTSAYG